MKPQNQTIIDPENGNCTSAAVATITGLPLSDFPNVLASNDDYYPELTKYLDGHGWIYLEVKIDFYFIYRALQGVPIILSVPSQSFEGKQHAVVACLEASSWKLLHDPNPNNEPYNLRKIKITEYSLVFRKDGLP